MHGCGWTPGQPSNDISQRVVTWRAWLLQLDPTGKWERRVRLGGRPTELEPAPLTFDEIGAREDLALTARLTREFDELNSLSHRPPRCPDCAEQALHLRTAVFQLRRGFCHRESCRFAERLRERHVVRSGRRLAGRRCVAVAGAADHRSDGEPIAVERAGCRAGCGTGSAGAATT
ncbi:DUF746 domain-containing protein [Burkholderia multivorans]|nr:DUF746 domain-containing protein [Burkholderia multivorans]MCA8485475.1 DUF746 domain-containing protein [Burkholderia multivorans]MDN7873750.1 DUF746 domain-containing protein [Burkholderia multivorans]